MMADLARLWDELERGPCRVIVLTGAGDRAFCAGADLSGDLSASPEKAAVVGHALLKHHVFSKPIVAAVNGDCAGGGVELLLSTDIRAAAPHARFGLPEVTWSVYPFGGATIKLVQQIGFVHAMDLLLTGRLIDAAEAARLGLINRVVPAEGLMAWALETAEVIASNSPAAVQAVKRQISSTIAAHALSREPMERSWATACGPAPSSARASPPSARSAVPATTRPPARAGRGRRRRGSRPPPTRARPRTRTRPEGSPRRSRRTRAGWPRCPPAGRDPASRTRRHDARPARSRRPASTSA